MTRGTRKSRRHPTASGQGGQAGLAPTDGGASSSRKTEEREEGLLAPTLLQLPGDLLFAVLAAASSQPFKNAAFMAVCKRFFTVLAAKATSLTLLGAKPSPTLLALLRSAASLRHLNITGCEGTWPLTHLLPLLPHLQSIELQPTTASLPLLPPSLQHVHIKRVDVSSPDALCLALRVQDRLSHGAVVIQELIYAPPSRTAPAAPPNWSALDRAQRMPHVRKAQLHLEVIPPCVFTFTPLDDLELHRSVSLNGIGRLAQLRSLSLEDCEATTLPPAIGSLRALTRLYMQRSQRLERLPTELGQLSALEELDLNRLWNLDELPSTIGELSALKALRIYGCAVRALPTSIGRLLRLTRLDLSDCSWLEQLPIDLASLPVLHTLVLTHEELYTGTGTLLPTSLHRMTSLRTLKLTTLPDLDELSSLTWLQSLEVQLNSFQDGGCCPPFMAPLHALTSLTLDNCDFIDDLPDEIGALSELRELRIGCCQYSLDFGDNRFKQLPEAIGALTALTSLHIWVCVGFRTLPASLGRLSALRELDISHCCNLNALPASITGLVSLTRLALRGCDSLPVPPRSVRRLPALKQLDFDWW